MNIESIRAAAARLKGHARVTPLLSSPFLDDIAGRRVLVKAECLQHTGSFKYRGARAALSAMDATDLARGVIAFSSGNHAQGIALAARDFDTRAVIIMPSDAPKLKIANTRALGAEIVLYDRALEDRDAIGARLAKARRLTLVKPFDDPMVIAGQGSVGLEIAAQAPGLGTCDVLIPCGGGGLTSGISLALAADAPTMRARPVEPKHFDDVARSLISGHHESNTRSSGSLCDAIITPTPGILTLPIMSALCGPGMVVTEEQALRAMALAFVRLKIVIEPGGAVALAAALFYSDKIKGDTVICVASGGNVDATIFANAVERFGDL